jgi:tRNA A-37 threonylcarbamoyl transferase component Bud32
MVETSSSFGEMELTCGECGQDFADPTNIFCMYCGRPREKLVSGTSRSKPSTTNRTNQSLADDTFNMYDGYDANKGGGSGGAYGGSMNAIPEANHNPPMGDSYGGARQPQPEPIIKPMPTPPPDTTDYSRERTASALVDVGELEFEAQLAEGSTAIVWSGQYQGAPAALKKVKYSAPKNGEEDVKEDEEMKREAYLMTKLRHPNIIQFFALSFHEGSLVLVMELMKCSFRDLIDQNPRELTLQAKGKILMGTCLGLKYLHSRKPIVIHRDLKSMNVLIDEGMSAKLTDFGISRAKQSAAQALTSFSGTVAWMAPELLSAQATYTESVDVYALAMVFFEALTLEIPWNGYHVGQMVTAVAHSGARPQLWPTTSHAESRMQKLMQKCWSQEAHLRPTMPDVCKEMKDIMQGF